MPSFNTLDPSGLEHWNGLKQAVKSKSQPQDPQTPLTRDQAASAIHKIVGAPLKHTLYIPDGYTPWIEVVGDRVTVEMRAKEPEAVYVTSTDMEAYWDSVAEWVDAQAAGMPKDEVIKVALHGPMACTVGAFVSTDLLGPTEEIQD